MPQSPYQVYSAGQQVNQGPGNRYIPPTYNYRTGTAGSPRNYNEMDWNNVQSYNLPQQQNNPYQQQYMQGLRNTTSRFGQMPQMPQFGSGPRMTYGGFQAQQRGGRGVHEFMANPVGYSSGRSQNWGVRDPYEGYLNYRERNPYGTDPGFNVDGPRSNGPAMSREEYTQWLRDTESGRYDSMYPDPYTGQRPSMPNFQGGGQGGMGGWQQMIMDFFSRMNPQQQGGGMTAGGEGAVKPGPNAPTGGTPYDKIGYRG